MKHNKSPAKPADAAFQESVMDDHHGVVEGHHRFSGVAFKGEVWDLSHLDAFALKFDPGLGFVVDVIVLFSCHCFSESLKRDGRERTVISDDEIHEDERETRVLNQARYEQSKEFLPRLIKELPGKTVRVARDTPQNFMTFEEYGDEGQVVSRYAVFFDVVKDNTRKKRLLLHVQSAYTLDELTERQRKANKVRFAVLLRKAYEGEKVS